MKVGDKVKTTQEHNETFGLSYAGTIEKFNVYQTVDIKLDIGYTIKLAEKWIEYVG